MKNYRHARINPTQTRPQQRGEVVWGGAGIYWQILVLEPKQRAWAGLTVFLSEPGKMCSASNLAARRFTVFTQME